MTALHWVQTPLLPLQQAKQAVLLADASKFEKQAMMKICSIQEFDILVTDKTFSEKEKKEVEKLGVKVEGVV
ncbi:MAG: hypothetical protein HXM91_07940 [Oribacterium sinus]|uniref:DeoR-like transcriptional repressor C-terminal sensor domain-containing protein n=1 Tax=Oribacterium sinus TaxID=237576 RepID=A0A930DZH1_9FIRM|nr:hypothetical protein [Oribacterium sinus]